MRTLKFAALSAAALLAFSLSPSTPKAEAQISVGIGIGAAPVCPYGYYGYAPYRCAPYGYYGSEWFTNGIFIGSGPWYHGHDHFYGHVNNRYDPHYGYHGSYPTHTEHYQTHDSHNFHSNGMVDEHGRSHVETHHR